MGRVGYLACGIITSSLVMYKSSATVLHFIWPYQSCSIPDRCSSVGRECVHAYMFVAFMSECAECQS